MKRLHDKGLIVYYLKKMFLTPHFDSQSTTEPKLDTLSPVSTHVQKKRQFKAKMTKPLYYRSEDGRKDEQTDHASLISKKEDH